ncbi:hypothetical protein [Calothrix sp. PCC 6303]|uniref:hypothetical protein n=1 Tax=Calothrix sp. PCC 6303 TaxID=1170562 RepID=UPI0002A00F07|nr:hypothetical protein [Calothrix sp. PCC 6303]AFZ01841.1 hypothetical protein Cal6303_2888 [Calothrix sp. PCC 6303]
MLRLYNHHFYLDRLLVLKWETQRHHLGNARFPIEDQLFTTVVVHLETRFHHSE